MSSRGTPDSKPYGSRRNRLFAVMLASGLPFAAFGEYAVTADVSGLAVATVRHQAYPWALIAFNVIALLLIAWGLVRRVRRRQSDRIEQALAAAGEDETLLPSVVRYDAGGVNATGYAAQAQQVSDPRNTIALTFCG